nr:hypothetical protein BaRGS_032183 [Batillaria attramentaria]
MTILMGDFNAKIGSDNTGYEDTIRTHGLGQMNENGERFADFCALNQLVIGGSIFPHKRIHKATWRSPDHVTENQIDHICISRKFRRSWRDVRVMRDIPPAETELPINCDKPSKAEIRKAIMTLRNGKAAGPDEIPAEAIKADTETAVNMLHSLFSKIWEKEEVPAQSKEGIVIKLPKKGDLRDCSNYRGIMLLSVPGKVLNRILLERMREASRPHAPRPAGRLSQEQVLR